MLDLSGELTGTEWREKPSEQDSRFVVASLSLAPQLNADLAENPECFTTENDVVGWLLNVPATC